jgi:5-methylcytosine-specific restriction enzyme A
VGIKDERKDRKRQRGRGRTDALRGEGPAPLQEKYRARELKNTAWWRKKIAAGTCHYCGKTVGPDALTMDHIIPLSRGGTSERFNIVAACKDCNNRKKYLLPSEWDEYLDSIKNPAQ